MSLLPESIWLPPGVSWKDLEGEDMAQIYHLGYPLLISVLLLVFREILIWLVFKPWSMRTSLAPVTLTDQDGAKLRKAKVAINERRKVQRKKFCETGWRWIFYLIAHLGGLYCMYDKPWIWDTRHCWVNYPFHEIEEKVWWYYMMEMSLYWCLFFTQFSDIKRKDFTQMFVHHVATLALLMFSWANHMHRMGSFVLLIHDFSDHWLEMAKFAKYGGYENTCNVVFVMFASTWLYTRLSIIPTIILYSTIFEAAQIVAMFPVYYIFNFLMTLLMILHVMWTYYILKIAYQGFSGGEVEDSRSDSDADDEDDIIKEALASSEDPSEDENQKQK